MRPILFSIGNIGFQSAPAFAGFSSLAAFLYCRSRRERLGLSNDEFWRLMLHLMAGVFFGSVALYVALYGDGPLANLRWALETRNNPGGSFLGALWGSMAAAWLFCRGAKRPFPPVADLVGTSGVLALAIMRWGCLLNGCCHGKPTTLPWGIAFRGEYANVRPEWRGVPLHPTQLYESVGCVLLALALHFFVMPRIRGGRLKSGAAFVAALGGYSVLRFFVEFFRGSDPGLVSLVGLNTAQLLCLMGLACTVWLQRRWQAGS